MGGGESSLGGPCGQDDSVVGGVETALGVLGTRDGSILVWQKGNADFAVRISSL